MGEGSGAAYRVLVGRPECKRQPGRPRFRWDDDIRMNLQEVGWEALTELISFRIGSGC
jgi:hypothetical protein